jgi:ketosteroid isomerase-like protein
MPHPATAVALLAACSALPTAAAPQALAITDVTVVDVREEVARPGMTVVISGDRIAAVGPSGSVAVPAHARVVDGTGRFLIPGLWDMHVHTGNDLNAREVVYPLYVAHGVTGIRNMSGDCFECPRATIEQVHARRRAVTAGELLGPRVVASSDYAGSHEQAARRSTDGSSPEAPATEADARAFVRLAKERGVDFIKIYDMLPREAYFALAEEANRLGLPVAGHVPVEVRASEASDAGQRSIEHPGHFNVLLECSGREDDLRARLIEEFYRAEMGARHTADGSTILPLTLEMVDTYHPGKCRALAERLVRNGTWLVPTLMTGRLPSERGGGWREDPYTRFLIPEERRFFEWAEEAWARDLGDAEERAPASRWVREITRTLHRAGVPMLAGSDAGIPGVFWGISLHQELELLVDAGLTEAEALRAATLGPAEFLGATDSLGTVEAGKLADLVLLDASPLQDISNTQRIAAAVLNGRYLDLQELDVLLAQAEAVADASREPSGASQAQPSGDDLEAAVRAEVEEQHRREQKAFVEGDCETVVSFYSDEATIYRGGRRVDDLSEALEFCRKLPRPFTREGEPPEISDRFYVLSGNAAHFVRTIDFAPVAEESPAFKREVVTKVWLKTNDGWKIVHFHSSTQTVSND